MLMLITIVVGTLIALPLIGLLGARLTSNQFVRETESSLISQAAIMAQIYANEYHTHSNGEVVGNPLNSERTAFYAQKFHHHPVSLTTKRGAILPERQDPAPTGFDIEPLYLKIGETFSRLALNAQRTSLAGYQAVDLHGNIIGGIGELEGGFAHIPEVQAALIGVTTSVLRYRSDRNRRHPLVSISRDTGFRVFVTMPVIIENHVVGAVYLTRTPSNLRSFLYRERQTLFWVAGSILLAAFVVGLLLWRLLVGPIRALRSESERVATGQVSMIEPLSHYGTKETAQLGSSIVSMSRKLQQRSDSLQSYSAHVTHELKSPLTSIIGAIELLEQSSGRMDEKARKKFYKNIQADGQRMTRLLDDLRNLAASDMKNTKGVCLVKDVIKHSSHDLSGLSIHYDGPGNAMLPIPAPDLQVVLTHLFQNALQHGATELRVSLLDETLSIKDNGSGISQANVDNIFQPFFTTNRDQGGTGMGLAIVQSTLASHNAQIHAKASENGGQFIILF